MSVIMNVIGNVLIKHRLGSDAGWILILKFRTLHSDLTVCLPKETIKGLPLPVGQTQYLTEEHELSLLLGQVL